MPDAFPAYDSITGATAMDCSGEIETVVYKKEMSRCSRIELYPSSAAR
jgi:hypothetical protein